MTRKKNYKKELIEFYEKNKTDKRILSNDEIKTKMNKFLSFSDYKLNKKFYEKYISEIIFGLDEGMCFTPTKVIGFHQIKKLNKYDFHEYEYFINEIIPFKLRQRDHTILFDQYSIQDLSISLKYEKYKLFKDLNNTLFPEEKTTKNKKTTTKKNAKKPNPKKIITKREKNYNYRYDHLNEIRDYLYEQKNDCFLEYNKYEYELLDRLTKKYKELSFSCSDYSKYGYGRILRLTYNSIHKVKKTRGMGGLLNLEETYYDKESVILETNIFGNLTEMFTKYIKHFNGGNLLVFENGDRLYQNELRSNPFVDFIKELRKLKINTLEIENFYQELISYYEKEQEKIENEVSNNIIELDPKKINRIELIDYSIDIKSLLNKHQIKIIEVDKKYLRDLVKVINHLNTRYNDIQKGFKIILQTNSIITRLNLIKMLKNSIVSYKSIAMHSIYLITSLKEGNLILFYEIIEKFDQLGIFNSNWQNDVSSKLDQVNNKLDNILYSVQSLEANIINSLNNLTYVTQESFKVLNDSVNSELKSINSSIKMNNLLAGIQAYQLYKVNKQTKGLLNN